MKKLLAVIGILDTLATILGALWWALSGSLPASLTELYRDVQTAFWIVLGIGVTLGIVLGVIIWQSQRQAPYLETKK